MIAAYLIKMVERAHVIVSGRVQGVLFRQSTKQKAIANGLFGWIRNLEDGRVEAVFEGETNALRDIVRWCRKGPDGALVEDVTTNWAEKPEDLIGFIIKD